jgi:hypothetical protein
MPVLLGLKNKNQVNFFRANNQRISLKPSDSTVDTLIIPFNTIILQLFMNHFFFPFINQFKEHCF